MRTLAVNQDTKKQLHFLCKISTMDIDMLKLFIDFAFCLGSLESCHGWDNVGTTDLYVRICWEVPDVNHPQVHVMSAR